MTSASERSPYLNLYIFLYNIVLFFVHLVMFVGLVDTLLNESFEFEKHFTIFCVGTAAQLLDVIHGILGITSTGVVAGSIQVMGRLAMLFIIKGNPNIHEQITTPVLLFAWVLIEIFRYPYYALHAWDMDSYALMWLRYSAWIPLYPLGLAMEWSSQVTSIRYYYESGKYSVPIPFADMDLNFGVVLVILAFIAMPFVSKALLEHMSKQRKKKLGEEHAKEE